MRNMFGYLSHVLDAQLMGDASYIEATEDRSECIYRREDHFQEERDAAVRDVKKAREQIVAQKRRIQELEEELSRSKFAPPCR